MSTRPWRLSLSTTTLHAVEHLRRTTERLSAFAEGFALSSLTDEELGELTAQRYTARKSKAGGTLFPWEAKWFARDLPAAPARILLGGAGTGRELGGLRDAGYDVVAFDPIAPERGDILRMSYEDLWAPEDAECGAAAARVQAGAPYDALLLGWGSFTHVPGEQRRLRTLQALSSLSSGPLLLSYWGRGFGAAAGRRATFPRRAGQRLGELFAAGQSAQDRQHDRILSFAGYGHNFSHAELDQLASACGYRARHFIEAYPHSTLTPIGNSHGPA